MSFRPSNPRTTRIREVVALLSHALPKAALGEMFDITGGGIYNYQRELKVAPDLATGQRLLYEFLRLEKPPQFEALNRDEQRRLELSWWKMRQEAGITTRQQQDDLLIAMNDLVPTFIICELLGIGPEAISARRSKLGLSGEHGDTLRASYLSGNGPAPQIDVLEEVEQRVLNAVWVSARASHVKQKAERRITAEKTLHRKLRQALEAFQHVPVRKCSNADCHHVWPRRKEFFPANPQSKDGLDNRCRICEWRRGKYKFKRSSRAAPRILSRSKKARILEVLAQNHHIIPTQLICELFSINPNTLSQLRKELKISVERGAAKGLLADWLHAETLPIVIALNNNELQRLRRLWVSARRNHLREVQEQANAALDVLREDRTTFLRTRPGWALAKCQGHYCQGGESWPAHYTFLLKLKSSRPLCVVCAQFDKLQSKRKVRSNTKRQSREVG